MVGARSVDLYRLRRMVSELSEKKGRGTELISLYIPPKRPIHEVVSTLREEYGTASNIKSDQTRSHVQEALVKVMQRLKLYRRLPDNGLVIFCGALQTDGPGSESVFIYEIVPPKPVPSFLYRCDDHFHTDILRDMLKEEDIYGIISMDNADAAFGLIRGNRVEIIESITSGVPGKHRAGGQSARRFERLRESELIGYYKRVASHAYKAFMENDRIKGLIVSGPGHTKEAFVKGGYLDYRLKSLIVAVIDTNYAGEDGIYEVIRKADRVLRDVRLMEERRLVQRFLKEIDRDGLATYGMDQVMDALKRGAVETLLVSEAIDRVYLKVKCKRCGSEIEGVIDRSDYVEGKRGLVSKVCRCGSSDYEVIERDVIDHLDDLASSYGAGIEVISAKSEEGRMLLSFGGIAALLKYKLN